MCSYLINRLNSYRFYRSIANPVSGKPFSCRARASQTPAIINVNQQLTFKVIMELNFAGQSPSRIRIARLCFKEKRYLFGRVWKQLHSFSQLNASLSNSGSAAYQPCCSHHKHCRSCTGRYVRVHLLTTRGTQRAPFTLPPNPALFLCSVQSACSQWEACLFCHHLPKWFGLPFSLFTLMTCHLGEYVLTLIRIVACWVSISHIYVMHSNDVSVRGYGTACVHVFIGALLLRHHVTFNVHLLTPTRRFSCLRFPDLNVNAGLFKSIPRKVFL